MTDDERWALFLGKCREQLPAKCPDCGSAVERDEPCCSEAFDAHQWYEAVFGCSGDDDGPNECWWSMTFEALVGRDPQYGASVDAGPGHVRIDL